jgi:hypothetical protein
MLVLYGLGTKTQKLLSITPALAPLCKRLGSNIAAAANGLTAQWLGRQVGFEAVVL